MITLLWACRGLPGAVFRKPFLYAYENSSAVALLQQAMPRPSISLDEHRDRILEWSRNGTTIADMHRILLEDFHVSITERTLKNRLRDWRITKNIRADNNDEFHNRVTDLYLLRLSDKEIVRILKGEGHNITISSLIRIRKKLDLRKRVEANEKEAADADMLPIVAAELQNGTIKGYGRDMLHAHFWEHGCSISR